MNKFAWFMVTTIYLILATLVISVTADATGYALGSGVPDALAQLEDGTSIGAIWGFIQIYFHILFFNITDFPVTLSLLLFHPVALANGLLLISLLPFT